MTFQTLCRAAIAAAAALIPALAAAEPTPQPLALRAAEDYLRQARYPAWSQALEPGAADPVLDARIPTRQSRLGPDGTGPRLSVWNSTVSALPGEAVTLFAALAHTGGKSSLLDSVPARGAAVTGARISAELRALRAGTLGTVTYRDDGIAPDTTAGDGIHTARFMLPTAGAPALGQADSVMVVVTAALPGGDERKAAGGFQFSNPAARLTGRYTDAVRDGHLIVAAEVEVLAPGRVHLSGTLADALHRPFATAQAARELQPGRQWLELPFYGLAFHDHNVAGAFRLASVTLASTGSMPNALGPVAMDVHLTRAYNLAQFARAPFNRPDLVDSANRLGLDAAATVPSLR